jgi:uncharacterized OB-fold protein
MDRQARIDEMIAACTECGSLGFPKRSDCDGCIAAVNEEIAAEEDSYGDRLSAITVAIATGG